MSDTPPFDSFLKWKLGIESDKEYHLSCGRTLPFAEIVAWFYQDTEKW